MIANTKNAMKFFFCLQCTPKSAIIRYSHNTTKRFGFNTFILCGAFQAVSLQLRRRLLAAQSASVCLLTPISIEFRSFANRINSKWIFTPRGLHTPSTFFYINFKNHIFFYFVSVISFWLFVHFSIRTVRTHKLVNCILEFIDLCMRDLGLCKMIRCWPVATFCVVVVVVQYLFPYTHRRLLRTVLGQVMRSPFKFH